MGKRCTGPGRYGIAVGSGTDVAAKTAGVILVRSVPKDVVQMIAFGKAAYRKMTQTCLGGRLQRRGHSTGCGILYTRLVLSPVLELFS